MVEVPGRDMGDIMLYTLSTCVWCKKTKALLGELGVGYRYVDVDLLSGAEREKAMREMARWNPGGSFPTIVLHNQRCVVGYNEAALREAAGA